MAQPVQRAEKLQAVRQYIAKCVPPPYAFTKRARDLTWTEARDTVFGLSGLQLHLDDSVVDEFNAARDGDGKVLVTPKPQPAAASPFHKGVFDLRPDAIYGVQFLYIQKFSSEGVIRKTLRRGRLSNLDPRFIVLLAWLCERLRKKWGAQYIYHLGFPGDAKHDPDDAHNWGRAFDFAGVAGVHDRALGAYQLTVLKNWGMHPIVMPVDWGTIDPKTRKHKFQKGKRVRYPNALANGMWPIGFRDTTFRLEMPDEIDAVGVSGTSRPEVLFAHAVFQDVYDVVATEGKDTKNAHAPPTTIGKDSRYIVHPDHRSTKLRKHHQNHIHIQIGPTRRAGFWAS